MNVIKKFLPSLFIDLNKNKIEYLILRGYEKLPYDFENDIDFFVKRDHLEIFYNTISRFSNKYQFIVYKDEVRQGLIKIQLKFSDSSILKIDLFFEFRYAGQLYIDEKNMYKKSISFNNINIVNYEYEFYTSILKELLHNSRIRKDKLEKLRIIYFKISDNNIFYDNILKIENIKLINKLLFSYRYIDYDLSKKIKKDILIYNLKNFGFLRCFFNFISFFYIKYFHQNVYDKVIFTNLNLNE